MRKQARKPSKHDERIISLLINGLSPQYLSDLVSAPIGSSSNYNLRNSNNIHLVNARNSLYYNSFLPSTVRDWNNIRDGHRHVDSVIAFKNVLSRDKPIVPKHYIFGNRKEQILHTRLRTNCSVLNYSLYLKNIIDSPLCRCNMLKRQNISFSTVLSTITKGLLWCKPSHVSVQLHWILCSMVIALSPFRQIVTSLKQYNSF